MSQAIKWYIVTASLFFIMACNKRSVPVITGRTIEPTYPTSTKTIIKADIANGKSLFETKCHRCHGLPDVAAYSQKKWDMILERMIPKVRATDQQAADIRAYVEANIKE